MSTTKRDFLKIAGASAAVLGLHEASRAAAQTRSWDVIVVGGGTAGLPTAIFAAARDDHAGALCKSLVNPATIIINEGGSTNHGEGILDLGVPRHP